MRHSPFILTVCITFSIGLQAQDDETRGGRISPKELTIPPSPVFDLMGVTSSQVNRTSDIKDFKVDWSFKSWKLSPNLAIQSQPFWEFFYNRKDLSKYQSAPGIMRKLSSLDVSIGTVQDENDDRRIGYAIKVNLFKQKDPLMAGDLYAGISEKFSAERRDLETQLAELKTRLDTTIDILSKPNLRTQILSTEEQLMTLNSRRMSEINTRAKVFVSENWNASSLDVAFGSVYSYKTDSAGSLKSLRLNRNTGYGGWVNGNLGIGRKILLTGLFRASWYEEELDFLLRDELSGEEISTKAIADNTLYSAGVNLRYGGSLFTFFMEFLYEGKGLKTAAEALNDVFKAPGNFQVVSSSVKWDVVHPNTVSIGGDWRIGRNVILNYGMRCLFDGNWKFKTFTPIATVSCMMR